MHFNLYDTQMIHSENSQSYYRDEITKDIEFLWLINFK